MARVPTEGRMYNGALKGLLRRAFSLQVAPCGNSISGVAGGPQLGLSGGV